MPESWHEEGAAAGDIQWKARHIMINYQGKRSGTNVGCGEKRTGSKKGHIKKSEDQHETNFQCNGYNFIKTSVIQHTPFKRPMEGIFEMPDFEVKTEIFNENIKIEPDAEDFLPTSSNLKNEVSVIVSDQSSYQPYIDLQKAMLSGPFSTRPKIQNQIFQEAQSLLATNSFEELFNNF